MNTRGDRTGYLQQVTGYHGSVVVVEHTAAELHYRYRPPACCIQCNGVRTIEATTPTAVFVFLFVELIAFL